MHNRFPRALYSTVSVLLALLPLPSFPPFLLPPSPSLVLDRRGILGERTPCSPHISNNLSMAAPRSSPLASSTTWTISSSSAGNIWCSVAILASLACSLL